MEDVVSDWKDALERLRGETQEWGEALGWAVRTFDEKTIGERELGFYSVPIWEVESSEGYVTFEPHRRLTEGYEGRVDLYSSRVQVHLERREAAWTFVDANGVELGPWDETTFGGLIPTLISPSVSLPAA